MTTMTASTMDPTALETSAPRRHRDGGRHVARAAAWIRPWLRLEGLAVFAAGLVGFLALGLPWYAFVLLLLVPDLSAIGYLARAADRRDRLQRRARPLHGRRDRGHRPGDRDRPADGRRGDPRRAQRHGPAGRLRPQAPDLVPGHAPRSHRSQGGVPVISRTAARGATCPRRDPGRRARASADRPP